MRKILVIDDVHPVFVETLQAAGYMLVDGTAMNRAAILELLPDFYGAEIRSRIAVDREFLDRGKNLRFVARAGAGMEGIDIAYAKQKGIVALNSPEGNRDAVAEHALGMLLGLLNNLPIADREVREGQWNREANRGIELGGKTVALLGYGNTGAAFAQRLSGMKVTVLVYDKYKSDFGTNQVIESDMQRIFDEADILSLHLPLNAETEFLVNTDFINRFTKKILLINTARGRLVATADVVEAMKSGKVAGLCLDVNEYEDASFEKYKADQAVPEPMRYLRESRAAILTPHIAGWTHESKRKIAEVLAAKIIAVG